jgi:hypothetical protein
VLRAKPMTALATLLAALASGLLLLLAGLLLPAAALLAALSRLLAALMLTTLAALLTASVLIFICHWLDSKIGRIPMQGTTHHLAFNVPFCDARIGLGGDQPFDRPE